MQHFLALVGSHAFAVKLQQFGRRQDGGQWCAEFVAGHGHEAGAQVIEFALLGQRGADVFFGLLAFGDVQSCPDGAVQEVLVVDSLSGQGDPEHFTCELAHLQLALEALAFADGLRHFATDLQVLFAVQVYLLHGVEVIAPQAAEQVEHGRVGPAEPSVWREKGNAHH